jgi:hypothetical protein
MPITSEVHVEELSEEVVGRALARWLAPYLAHELAARHETRGERRSDASYDASVCAEYVRNLGDVVLANAARLFGLLARDGEVGSLALVDAIGVDGPRAIPSVLTTPLKRRAKAMGLAYPWNEDVLDDRTLWVDRDGIATRMLTAISAEKDRRNGRRAA